MLIEEPRQNNIDDIRELESTLKTKLPKPSNVIRYQSDDGYALVGFGYYYINTDIELFIVAHGKWASKQIIKHAFTYVFDQLNCIRCTVKVINKNKKAKKLIKRLGFVKEGDLRGLNISIYSLLKKECKYYEQKETK